VTLVFIVWQQVHPHKVGSFFLAHSRSPFHSVRSKRQALQIRQRFFGPPLLLLSWFSFLFLLMRKPVVTLLNHFSFVLFLEICVE
jgi:hypothetical protein